MNWLKQQRGVRAFYFPTTRLSLIVFKRARLTSLAKVPFAPTGSLRTRVRPSSPKVRRGPGLGRTPPRPPPPPLLPLPEGTPSPASGVGGRLQGFLDPWLSLIQDKWVQEIIRSGYKIEFLSSPADRFFASNLRMPPERLCALQGAVLDFLAQGVVVPVPHSE